MGRWGGDVKIYPALFVHKVAGMCGLPQLGPPYGASPKRCTVPYRTVLLPLRYRNSHDVVTDGPETLFAGSQTCFHIFYRYYRNMVYVPMKGLFRYTGMKVTVDRVTSLSKLATSKEFHEVL
jgi:hypothetical protein